jgi:hypothetical protein
LQCSPLYRNGSTMDKIHFLVPYDVTIYVGKYFRNYVVYSGGLSVGY